MGRGDGQKGQLGHGQWESLTSKGRLLNKAFPGVRTSRNEETLNPKIIPSRHSCLAIPIPPLSPLSLDPEN